MASVYQNPTYQAKIGYSGFDMSNRLKFSSTVGELLPIYKDILQPGDKVSLSVELRSRTMPLASSAMVSLKEHIEWYFVPIQQIYSLFPAFYYSVQDISSSVFDIPNTQNQIPYFYPGVLPQAMSALITASDKYFVGSLRGTGTRLLELLDTPWTIWESGALSLGYCPLFACAYQKIWSDYYRDSEREQNNPSIYNLDKWHNDTNELPQSAFLDMHTLRYRRWKQDFFTSVKTSPLFAPGAIGNMGFHDYDIWHDQLTHSFQQWLTSSNFDVYDHSAWTSFSTTGHLEPSPVGRGEMPPTISGGTQIAPSGLGLKTTSGSSEILSQFGNLQQALSPTSIRTSFAVQKLLEITRRAGKHYDDQQLAHFGVKLPKGIDGECYYLGAQHGEIRIGDVIATSSYESENVSTVLGQVSGKGFGYTSGNSIKFEAPTHGILMAIYSCEPDVDYGYGQYDKLNTLMNRADWYNPAFDNLGMQPLFRYQGEFQTSASDNYDILGYQYRYMELKAKYNRVRGSLARSLSDWTPKRLFSHDYLNDFYINPNYLDDVMLVNYAYSPMQNVVFDTDPLFHEVYFDVKKASKMSTYGLESL